MHTTGNPDFKRVKINQNEKGMQIIVHTNKKIPYILFQGLWLSAWGYALYQMYLEFMSTELDWSMTLELIFVFIWAFAGFVLLRQYLWLLLGREKIEFTFTQVILKTSFWNYIFPSSYDMQKIQSMRITRTSRLKGRIKMKRFMSMGSNRCIAFNYGDKSACFGLSLGQAEANYLLDIIKSRYSNLVEY